ncbi:hypothetical protein FACS189425_08090 [Clostridia bacterium]|nr:hypothetical protein FACS189425_08090 [Clostridia bacterium]
MTKWDKFVFYILILAAVMWIAVINPLFLSGKHSKVVIIQNGTVKAEYKLSEIKDSEQVRIDSDLGFNVVELSKTAVSVIEASCPDKLCQENTIDKPNQAIVCLPNKLIVKIVGNNEAETVAY